MFRTKVCILLEKNVSYKARVSLKSGFSVKSNEHQSTLCRIFSITSLIGTILFHNPSIRRQKIVLKCFFDWILLNGSLFKTNKFQND